MYQVIHKKAMRVNKVDPTKYLKNLMKSINMGKIRVKGLQNNVKLDEPFRQ
jgi:predicted FMN-binding regulatory protein PaiB